MVMLVVIPKILDLETWHAYDIKMLLFEDEGSLNYHLE